MIIIYSIFKQNQINQTNINQLLKFLTCLYVTLVICFFLHLELSKQNIVIIEQVNKNFN